jgi:predicted transcriptional regulator
VENGIEKKILEEMAFRLVATKGEIVNFVTNGTEISSSAVDAITKSLVERGCLTKIYSSTTSYAITQKGIKQSKI